ncbi:hypothetical protein U1Q18_032535 [Sarracenia purpurea var. burkii]
MLPRPMLSTQLGFSAARLVTLLLTCAGSLIWSLICVVITGLTCWSPGWTGCFGSLNPLTRSSDSAPLICGARERAEQGWSTSTKHEDIIPGRRRSIWRSTDLESVEFGDFISGRRPLPPSHQAQSSPPPPPTPSLTKISL